MMKINGIDPVQPNAGNNNDKEIKMLQSKIDKLKQELSKIFDSKDKKALEDKLNKQIKELEDQIRRLESNKTTEAKEIDETAEVKNSENPDDSATMSKDGLSNLRKYDEYVKGDRKENLPDNTYEVKNQDGEMKIFFKRNIAE